MKELSVWIDLAIEASPFLIWGLFAATVKYIQPLKKQSRKERITIADFLFSMITALFAIIFVYAFLLSKEFSNHTSFLIIGFTGIMYNEALAILQKIAKKKLAKNLGISFSGSGAV